MSGVPSPLMRPAVASNGIDHKRVFSVLRLNAILFPSDDRLMLSFNSAPVVRRSGPALQPNVLGSTVTRQTFLMSSEVPSKNSASPAGDQTKWVNVTSASLRCCATIGDTSD